MLSTNIFRLTERGMKRHYRIMEKFFLGKFWGTDVPDNPSAQWFKEMYLKGRNTYGERSTGFIVFSWIEQMNVPFKIERSEHSAEFQKSIYLTFESETDELLMYVLVGKISPKGNWHYGPARINDRIFP